MATVFIKYRMCALIMILQLILLGFTAIYWYIYHHTGYNLPGISTVDMNYYPNLNATDYEYYDHESTIFNLSPPQSSSAKLNIASRLSANCKNSMIIKSNARSKCRNAILDKENIDIHHELKTHLPKIYNIEPSHPFITRMIAFLLNRTIPQFWGREQPNALLQIQNGGKALKSKYRMIHIGIFI